MTAIGVSVAVLAVWWFSRTEPHMTTTEWRERMRKLNLGVK